MMATAPNQIMLGLPNCMKQRLNIGARGATRSAMLTSPAVLACETDCPQSFRAEFRTSTWSAVYATQRDMRAQKTCRLRHGTAVRTNAAGSQLQNRGSRTRLGARRFQEIVIDNKMV
jgi:hypothetical protein